MGGYTKLFQSIIHSTIWREPDHVRLVWVTMLALADAHGVVEASVPGLADIARVTLDQCCEALKRFQQPDDWSRNKSHQGRRIEPTVGGWQLLNHKHYRDLLSAEQRREKDAERKRNERASAKRPSPSENVREVAHSEAAPDPTPAPEAGQLQSEPAVWYSLKDWQEPAGLEDEALMACIPRDYFRARLKRLRNTRIGGKAGTLDRTQYVRDLFPRWKLDSETEREKVRQSAQDAPGSRFAPRGNPGPDPALYAWVPAGEHREFASSKSLDLAFAVSAYRAANGPEQQSSTVEASTDFMRRLKCWAATGKFIPTGPLPKRLKSEEAVP